MKNISLPILFVLFVMLSPNIFACMCGHTSISDMYKDSAVIVIAKVKGFKPTSVKEDFIHEDGRVEIHESNGQEVNLKIDRWFKGRKLNDYLTLSQPNSTCDWSFDKDDVNKDYLFYLYFDKKYKTYSIIPCGRSKSIEKANDDLSWLKNLPKSLNRTRLSGVVSLNDDKNLFPRIKNIKIKISGENKEYNLITDKDGLYEIWDVPVGKYTINAEIPEDKILDWTTSVPDDWTYFWSIDKPDYEALKVTLQPKSSAGVNFMLENKK